MANIFAEKGLSVHIISTTTTQGPCPYPLNSSVKLLHAGITSKDKKRLGWLKYIRKVNKYLLENNIQAVFGAGRQVCMMMYFFDRSIKKVAWEHFNYQSLMEHRPFGKITNLFRKFIYPRLDALVCLTQGDAENYYAFMDRKKVHVIPNSLSFMRDKTSDLTAKRIIAVGRLEKEKNFSALVEVAESMRGEIPDWHIDIFGGGSEEQKIRELIAEKGLGDFVSIHEPVTDIKSEYLSSGIMAATSIFKGFHLEILEAEACGLPVVSFDCKYGPAALIHDGVNGYLVEVGDVKGLAERITAIAKDKDLRRKMVRAAFENAGLYEPERIAEKWMSLLERL